VFRLRTLGSVGLTDPDGRNVAALLAQPKRLALLIYLAAARPAAAHRRDQLLPHFWPDLDEIHARDALNQALRFLRQTLGARALVGHGTDGIGVDPAHVWCDAVAFRAALDDGRPAEALELYHGPFLPGFFADGAVGFEQWLEAERQLLIEAAAQGARQIADHHEAHGSVTLAIRWGRQAMDLVPDDERWFRRLLRLYQRAGDLAGALKAYDEFARRLQREYDCQPAAETRVLAEALRSGHPPSTAGSQRETETGAGGISGRYRVERPLGAGSMATVYLARDLRHERDVALKILRPDITESLARERFVREIRIAGRLQHPNIVPLFDSGESDGRLFYIMPYVKGETLREWLTRAGRLTVDDAVHVLREIGVALVHAHDQDVIHRDIKPENILLIERRAVVTDFGIARAAHAAQAAAGHGEPGVTGSNLILGTPAYMAPEQVAGSPKSDHRADLFALGVLGYEMLAGRPPFRGATPQEVLTAVLVEMPEPLFARRPDIPPPLANLIMGCLEKKPGDRPQSARELLTKLDAAVGPNGFRVIPSSPKAAPRAGKALRYWVGALILAGAALTIANPVLRFRPYQVTSTHMLVSTDEVAGYPSISPDGQLFAFTMHSPARAAAGRRILVRQVDGTGEYELAPGLTRLYGPQWSPDGTTIFFARGLRPDTQIAYVVPALGGEPRPVIGPTYQILDPIWHPDGQRILYFSRGRIWSQRLDGGNRILVPVDSGWMVNFDISPDATRLAYARGAPARRVGRQTIWTAPLEGGTPVRLTDSSANSWSPRWAPDGRSLLYISDAAGVSDIYQQRISNTGNAVGTAVRITTGLGAGQISMDRSGRRVIFLQSRTFTPLFTSAIPVAGEISASALRMLTGQRENVQWPDLSRDGWLAFDSDRGGRGDGDIYKMPRSGGEAIRLTTDPGSDFMPKWSPDGREIVYYRVGPSDDRRIRIVSADGQNDRAVTSGIGQQRDPAWGPSGNELVFVSDSTLAIVERNLEGNWSNPRLLAESSPAVLPRWSPTGRWIAYSSRGAIRLISPSGGPPRTLVENGALGGPATHPIWSPDSRTVFVTASGKNGYGYSFWAVSVSGGTPRRLHVIEGGTWTPFATDGSHIYLTQRLEQGELGLLELRR
jgi:serine/threonine-protein kinase